ncbi:MAG: L-threonylcarbamoyladenylate synthase [Dermabacter sp.]|nr:L-threonylcarbamoyladenylate synthase [Dermabacter sp.]
MSVYDYSTDDNREESLQAAVEAVQSGQLIVVPTDTVYGIGADAFNADAVQALLDAKGRGRNVPPPVLIGDAGVLHALGVDIPPIAEDLADEYWPGALTLIVKAQPSLMWDLGESRGTVALRMPNHEGTLALLKKTGPLAVSSANKHGRDAATSIVDAATQLGDRVEVYLDAGPSPIGESSTIIDATVEPVAILRPGAITEEEIVAKFGPIFTPEPEPEPEPELEAESEQQPESEAEVAPDSVTEADAEAAPNDGEAPEADAAPAVEQAEAPAPQAEGRA